MSDSETEDEIEDSEGTENESEDDESGDSDSENDDDDSDEDDEENEGVADASAALTNIAAMYLNAIAEEAGLLGDSMPALYERALKEEGPVVQTDNKTTQTDPLPELAPLANTLHSESDLEPSTLLHITNIESIAQNLSCILEDIKRTVDSEKKKSSEPYSYPNYATPKRLQPEAKGADVIWGSAKQDEPTLASRYARHRAARSKRCANDSTFSENELLKHSASILLKPNSAPQRSQKKPPQRFQDVDYSPPPKSKTLELYHQKKPESNSKAEEYLNHHLKKTLTTNPKYNPDERPASFL